MTTALAKPLWCLECVHVMQPFLHQLWSVTVSMGFVCRLDEAVRRIAGHSSSKSSAQKGGETEFGKNVSRNELVER